MKITSNPRIKTILVIAICALSIGCSTISNPPDFDNYISQQYKVDGAPLTLRIPAGGGDSVDAKLTLNTGELSEDTIFLNQYGYDLYQSSTAYFDLTHLLFGLSNPDCCSLEKIAIGYPNTTSKSECINQRQWLHYFGVQPDGDYFAGYSTPFNSRYVLFLNMRIDEAVANDQHFVNERLSFLKEVIKQSEFPGEKYEC